MVVLQLRQQYQEQEQQQQRQILSSSQKVAIMLVIQVLISINQVEPQHKYKLIRYNNNNSSNNNNHNNYLCTLKSMGYLPSQRISQPPLSVLRRILHKELLLRMMIKNVRTFRYNLSSNSNINHSNILSRLQLLMGEMIYLLWNRLQVVEVSTWRHQQNIKNSFKSNLKVLILVFTLIIIIHVHQIQIVFQTQRSTTIIFKLIIRTILAQVIFQTILRHCHLTTNRIKLINQIKIQLRR